MTSDLVFELSRLLVLFKQAKQSMSELSSDAVVPFCGQWSLLVLACMALLTLILSLLCLKKTSTAESGERDLAALFSLAKTAYKAKHMHTLMDMLMEEKINVDTLQEPGTGLTLLLCACISGQRKLVEYLLLKGANLHAVSIDGDTALILATYACCTVKGADPGLLDLLACRGVSVNTQNCRGDSPLSIAALYGNTELISVLLQYGADAHITDNTGCLPIDLAGCCGYQDVTKLLNKQMARDLSV